MSQVFLTASYIIAHLATACVCIGVAVAVPFVAVLILIMTSGDPGGPLFFPMFLLLLVLAGLVIALILSTATVLSDLARFYWSIPIWVPPVLIFCIFAILGDSLWAIVFGIVASLSFSLYWLSVSSAWVFPRLVARRFGVQYVAPNQQSGAA